jgi:hypothetical protein
MKSPKKCHCVICGSELTHNIIGLNKKLIGRDTVNHYCAICLADYLDTTPEHLEELIEEFKVQGCALFV